MLYRRIAKRYNRIKRHIQKASQSYLYPSDNDVAIYFIWNIVKQNKPNRTMSNQLIVFIFCVRISEQFLCGSCLRRCGKCQCMRILFFFGQIVFANVLLCYETHRQMEIDRCVSVEHRIPFYRAHWKRKQCVFFFFISMFVCVCVVV